MTTDGKSVEDSIKIALDAADANIKITDEYERIRKDYSAVEAEVKKLYKNATTVFVSSAVASLIAVVAASMMYYRTIEAMETSNNTSLEALVIFAENVDKLALATSSLDETMSAQAAIADKITETQETLARIEEQQLDVGSTAEQLTELGETTSAAMSEFSGAMLERFDTDLMKLSQEMTDSLAGLNAAQAELAESVSNASGGGAPIELDPALDMKLETVLMLQKEISAKITAANNPPQKARTPARTVAKPKPVRKTDPPISFP
jgi:hypothetical protein